MSGQVLATKLFIPVLQPNTLRRDRLIRRLHKGLPKKLTIISAAAGFGKTTLLSEWVDTLEHPVAWISIDSEHNDPVRFILYLLKALQKVIPHAGEGLIPSLLSSPPPPIETVMVNVINELAQVPDKFVLILDDYHVLDAQPVDQALRLLIEHLPPCVHLVLSSREDPPLPLSRLRAKGHLAEIRAQDLRFLPNETEDLLSTLMGLKISHESISALNNRTEGWIAGLQLAALSLQGRADPESFVKDFTGSNRYILDYLVEEVLQQQPEDIQEFLIQTSILKRLCGPLCDAVNKSPDHSGQETLEYLERSNLFLIPLDDKREWYRYHHLFAEFLYQRIGNRTRESELHTRASQWYEEHKLEIEAFQHAAAAGDIDRAEALIVGKEMPLYFRGAVVPVIQWLDSLPLEILEERPVLNIHYASVLLFMGKTMGVEEKLRSAERKLAAYDQNDRIRDLTGHIAVIRASLALTRHDGQEIFKHSQLALEYLNPNNIPVRTATTWLLAYAYHLLRQYEKAIQLYSQALSVSKKIGHRIVTISCTLGIGEIQEGKGRLRKAEETYKLTLERAGKPPLPVAADAYLGLARIYYEWNEINSADEFRQLAESLAQQQENTDRYLACRLFQVHMLLGSNEISSAAVLIKDIQEKAIEKQFTNILPDIEKLRVRVLIHQKKLSEAETIADTKNLPEEMARVLMAQGRMAEAAESLDNSIELYDPHYEAREVIRLTVLRSIALFHGGEREKAITLYRDLIETWETENFMRSFIDDTYTHYGKKLLNAIKTTQQKNGSQGETDGNTFPPLFEALSRRELEVLILIARGDSNRDISEALFISLSTVKGHNRLIFEKLQVNRRTEAVAKARNLGLI
ncbi:MAG: LuxR C-terminal-related transcriptional regulator [Spirochaetia bacterium]